MRAAVISGRHFTAMRSTSVVLVAARAFQSSWLRGSPGGT